MVRSHGLYGVQTYFSVQLKVQTKLNNIEPNIEPKIEPNIEPKIEPNIEPNQTFLEPKVFEQKQQQL